MLFNISASRYTFCIALLLLAVSLTILPQIIDPAMNMDGAMYASMARNLHDGVGSLWVLTFSETMQTEFYEHPPLLMWMQAGFMRLFGTGNTTEYIYGLLLLILACVATVLLLRALTGDKSYVSACILLVLLLVAGEFAWGFTNNTLDAQVSVFSCFSVLFFVYAAKARPLRSGIGWSVAASAMILLAVATKGVVGLFPLAAPGLYWAAHLVGYDMPTIARKAKATVLRPFAYTLMAMLILGLSVLAVVHFPPSATYFERYVQGQLVASLTGARGSTGSFASHAFLLLKTCGEILMVLIVGLFARRASFAKPPTVNSLQPILFALAVGLSASIPILISPRLYEFYFIPSLPFFALAAAIFVIPAMRAYFATFSIVRLHVLTCLILFCCLVAIIASTSSHVPKGPARVELDRTLAVTHAVGREVCRDDKLCGEVVAICPTGWRQFHLHAFLQRHYKLSMAKFDSSSDPEWLIWRTGCGGRLPPGYETVVEMGDLIGDQSNGLVSSDLVLARNASVRDED